MRNNPPQNPAAGSFSQAIKALRDRPDLFHKKKSQLQHDRRLEFGRTRACQVFS